MINLVYCKNIVINEKWTCLFIPPWFSDNSDITFCKRNSLFRIPLGEVAQIRLQYSTYGLTKLIDSLEQYQEFCFKLFFEYQCFYLLC